MAYFDQETSHRTKWGRWKFDADRLVLQYHVQGDYWYEIDLETVTTSAQMLDWIFQLRGKSWMDNEGLGNLIQALRDLLHPQQNYCSGGLERMTKARHQALMDELNSHMLH